MFSIIGEFQQDLAQCQPCADIELPISCAIST